MTHFVIAAPNYTVTSNGVMAIYQLGDILEALGHRVTFVAHVPKHFREGKSRYPKKHLDRFEGNPSRLPCDSIAIFPETTPDDVIQKIPSKHRVWYLLNKPYVLTGKPLCYRPDDLVVAYSALISKILYNLFLTREISELASGPNSLDKPLEKEPLILLYIGKSRKADVSCEVKKLVKKYQARVVIINRVFPGSREILFELLRKARLLISYDPFTNLNYEATLCGTPCYIVDNYMQLKYEDYNLPLHGFFEDVNLLEKYYLNGISAEVLKEIHEKYHAAQQESSRSVRGFVQLCQDWFSFAASANTDPIKAQFLAGQNNLRQEIDRLAFELGGQIHITSELHAHTISQGAFMSYPGRVSLRIERAIWNVRRNWYKHFCRFDEEALNQKLNAMREKYLKSYIDIRW